MTLWFISGLFHKHITIVNYDSSVVNKFGASLNDNPRVVIYDRNMFIVETTERRIKLWQLWQLSWQSTWLLEGQGFKSALPFLV
jgi:hypothetical protein